jgi:hypothetical protein
VNNPSKFTSPDTMMKLLFTEEIAEVFLRTVFAGVMAIAEEGTEVPLAQ